MCAWVGDLRTRLDSAFERGLPVMVDVLPTLAPAQIASIEKRYRETNDEYREDFVHRDTEKRRQKAVKREIERAEMFYGSLDEAQREAVVRSVAASPFDGEVAFAERLKRQQDALALMRRLAAVPASRDDTEAQIRAYVASIARSPRQGYRAYSERVLAHNCAFASGLHNTTSPAQRKAAARKIRSYETDLRELSADAAS